MSKPSVVFEKGWYPSEKDSLGSYRWMGENAVIRCRNLISGPTHLKLIAGHSFSDQPPPVMRCFAGGRCLGAITIESAFSTYAIAFDAAEGELLIECKLDGTFRVPGDPRSLGIMVRDIEIIDSEAEDPFLSGWYPEEIASVSIQEPRMRWMKIGASGLIAPPSTKEGGYLKLVAGHSYHGERNPELTLRANGEIIGETTIYPGERDYVFPVRGEKRIRVDLEVKKPFPRTLTDDDRPLGIMVKQITCISHLEEKLRYEDGWYAREYGEFFPFRWLSERGSINAPHSLLNKNRFLGGFMFSEYADFSQELEVSVDGARVERIALQHKWNFVSIPLRGYENHEKDDTRGALSEHDHEIVLKLNKLFPARYHKGDMRDLGVRVGKLECYDDEELHNLAIEYHRNSHLNYREMISGKCTLESYPLTLGIDLYSRCNINPPCVYCLWHSMKELEGEYRDAVVDEKTLKEYGPFFRSARTLVNCSFGEPMLHPRLKEILEFCDKGKKIMELSSNGQAITPKTIKSLVGKPLYLYISLDAACKETYAKIRNDRWDSIIPNLKLLNQERKKHDNLPKIYMVFMPMKVNRADLEEYFRLCREIDADALVLRPLLYLVDSKIEVTRGGYTFRYRDELLDRKEQEEIFRLCDIFSEKYGVPVANQFEFGETEDPDKGAGKPHLEFQRS